MGHSARNAGPASLRKRDLNKAQKADASRAGASRISALVVVSGYKEEVPVSPLRKMMIEEIERRNYPQETTRAYVHAVKDFAAYFKRSPDQLGAEHVREYAQRCWRVACTLSTATAQARGLFVSRRHTPYLHQPQFMTKWSGLPSDRC